MKTLNYIAVFILAIIFSVSFNSISSGSQQISDCPYCDANCTESGCCNDQKNTSQENSFACGDECTNDNCKELCSAGSGSAVNESNNNKEKSSVVDSELSCPDKNNLGNVSKDCCK